MKKQSRTNPTRHILIKPIRNACFSVFVFFIVLFAFVAITYQSSYNVEPLAKIFPQPNNHPFTPDTFLSSVNDSATREISTNATLESGCGNVNCSDPGVLAAIQSFNLASLKAIELFEYHTPVKGHGEDECDVSWRFRSTIENRNWRKYRDFRRYKMGYNEDCSYKVILPGRWHSGFNAFHLKGNNKKVKIDASVRDDEISDEIPLGSDLNFGKGRYLYYSRGGDYCKDMNQYMWSFLCGLGEAMYLNRTFVLDLSMCLSSIYTLNKKDEEGKDFRFYFDFEHLKEVAAIAEDINFIRDWKRWDKTHKRKILVRKVTNHRTTPMQLRREKSVIIWRQFDSSEPENYWFQVCDGPVAKYIERPWNVLKKSKALRNVADAISLSMDWDFDAVHVVLGEKARNMERWPHLDGDTSPDALVAKLRGMIVPQRNLYIATNEGSYSFFDELRSHHKVHFLDDYRHLWGNSSEWYNVTSSLNGGRAVEFDGYMRFAVDAEVLDRSKTRVEII